MNMKIYWINQPSKLQPCHNMHGQKVIADLSNKSDKMVDVYFCEGKIISARIPKICLSKSVE